jgi:hypothetical protein
VTSHVVLLLSGSLVAAGLFVAWLSRPTIALAGTPLATTRTIVKEYVDDLRRATKVYRLLGMSFLVLLVIGVASLVLEIVMNAGTTRAAALACSAATMATFAKLVFDRVERYESLLKEAVDAIR